MPKTEVKLIDKSFCIRKFKKHENFLIYIIKLQLNEIICMLGVLKDLILIPR